VFAILAAVVHLDIESLAARQIDQDPLGGIRQLAVSTGAW
jgi:hypothetical protein